jgi:hypothetical protein
MVGQGNDGGFGKMAAGKWAGNAVMSAIFDYEKCPNPKINEACCN